MSLTKNNTDLLSKYKNLCVSNDMEFDSAQSKLIVELQKVAEQVVLEYSSWWSYIKYKFVPLSYRRNKGLYIWGDVGRGKTFLMDLFFAYLPLKRKKRLHFYRFMQYVHNELDKLQGYKEPLKAIVKKLATENDVICFDEFFVNDIADAMLLGRLFEYIFSYGITLVVTSNVEPDNLYANGLQRSSFLPAIAGIKENMSVFKLQAPCDYRMRSLERLETYHRIAEDVAAELLQNIFKSLAPDKILQNQDIEICNRNIVAKQLSHDVVWFDFIDICESARSYSDYIEIARDFHTIVLSYVTVMAAENDDCARRFISLVDELYEHNVVLIIAAEESPLELYQGSRLKFEFARTISRITEMQTKAYISRAHQP